MIILIFYVIGFILSFYLCLKDFKNQFDDIDIDGIFVANFD